MTERLIVSEMASASGLGSERASIVAELVSVWDKHRTKNALKERYYRAQAPVKDLGVTVSPSMARKLHPHVDWAAKAVDWWAARVQFQGYTCDDEDVQATLDEISRLNDMDNLTSKVATSALKAGPSFLTVTAGDEGEPPVIVSGYPSCASSAVWSDSSKRIGAGLVVAETRYDRSRRERVPVLAYVLTDIECITLRRGVAGWDATVEEHGIGRVPMEPVAYRSTLENPFGTSRIRRPVRDLVDDAQREMVNMAACAAFSAAPQKYLMGADKAAIDKIAGTPFGAYVGSVFAATTNSKGGTPSYGQLPQLSMQPHSEYMRLLASMFSDATNVPLSSLGFSTTNPSSADAIIASKEDAVIDISAFISRLRRSLVNVAAMALAASGKADGYAEAVQAYDVGALFADPATPSPVSMSQAVQQRVAAFPWMADSDVPLRDLGYSGDELAQLRSDRRRSQAVHGARSVLDRNQVGSADNAEGAGPLS